MSVSGIGTTSTAPTTFAATVNTPAVQIAQAQAASTSALFGTVSGTTDVSAFTPTAAAYSLFLNPALLVQLQKWDGSATPGSQRPAPAAPTPPPAPQFSFNPFDQSSWYGDSTGTTLDATA